MVFARGLLVAAAAAAGIAAVAATTLPSIARVARAPLRVGSVVPHADFAAATARTARFLADAAAAAGGGGDSRIDAAAAGATLPATAARAALSPLIYGGFGLSRPDADVSTRIARLLRVPPLPANITYSCTGLLVTERHIVTLARCPYTDGQMAVLLGGIELAGGLPFNVTSRVAKPTFVPTTGFADVAVWTFEAPAFVNAAALARGGVVRGKVARDVAAPRPATRGFVGGWGITDPRRSVAPFMPDGLKVALQSVVSTALCRRTFQLVNETLPADQFCAAGASSGPCLRDEGGPLGVLDDGADKEFYFVGLVHSFFSSRSFFCSPSAPAVYTRLSAHLDFIARAVRPYTLSLF